MNICIKIIFKTSDLYDVFIFYYIKIVRFNDDKISIKVKNKGIVNIPCSYTERLASSDISSLKRNFRLIAKGKGIHFNSIDEDISLS